jgi:hypothetical protein
VHAWLLPQQAEGYINNMSFTFRPAIRQKTPLIVGVAGPTKSGKTMSSLRLATGMARGGKIAMINAEGARGHQYADKFNYVAVEMEAPFRPTRYTEAVRAAQELNPSVLIIDSVSHMHDGPGGILDWHEEELDRVAGDDQAKRQRATFAAWVKPKAAENEFIYMLLGCTFPVILALRAKEKIKLQGGKVIDLGWQPIVSDRVAFETIFTVMLTPHCKGVPDLTISDMREPFDTMIPQGRPLDEALGQQLAEWSAGTSQTIGITNVEWKSLLDAAKTTGHSEAAVKEWLKTKYSAASTRDIRREDYAGMLQRVADPAPLIEVAP